MDPSADLGKHQDLDVLILQEDGVVFLVYLVVGKSLVQSVRIDRALRAVEKGMYGWRANLPGGDLKLLFSNRHFGEKANGHSPNNQN
jgi:hypothetical protein